MNVFQYGVLNGLGWIFVLVDGYIFHWHWLAAAGLVLLLWSTWKIYEGINKTEVSDD